MPLQKEIDALVNDVDGAIGAIIVDYEGEAVITSHIDVSAYDVKVVGAYGGIFLDQLGRITRDLDLGAPSSSVIEGREARLLHHVLRDGYFIVLILKRNVNVSVARQRLQICYDRLVEEF